MSIPAKMDRDALERWMLAYLATICGRPSDSLNPWDRLAAYDLDSVDAVEMALELERAFGFPLHPETFMDNGVSVVAIADALAAGQDATPAPSAARPPGA